MTPAIKLLKAKNISYKTHEYTHHSASESYGIEAAEKMGVPKDQVFKTLVVSLNSKELVVGIIPVSSMLSMKLVAKAVGAKKAEMANALSVERSTGYIIGGVSPIGQKKKLTTIIDSSAKNHTTVYVSAGRRGLEIELCPHTLKKLVNGVFTEICQ